MVSVEYFRRKCKKVVLCFPTFLLFTLRIPQSCTLTQEENKEAEITKVWQVISQLNIAEFLLFSDNIHYLHRYIAESSEQLQLFEVSEFHNLQVSSYTFLKLELFYSNYNFTLEQKTAFIFMPNNQEDVHLILAKSESRLQDYKNGHSCYLWKPVFIIVWPEVVATTFEMEKTLLSIPAKEYDLKSDIYIVFFMSNHENVSSLHIWEIYWLKDRRFFRLVFQIGNNEFYISTKNLYAFIAKLNRREDFMGTAVVASTVNEAEYQEWVKVKVTSNNTIKLENGFSVLIYWDLMLMLNFTEQVVIGDWLRMINGSLAGNTISQLNHEQADISIVQASIIEFRAKFISFLQPTYHGLIQAFFQQPNFNSFNNVIIAPFQKAVWVAVLITWIITIIFVKFVALLKSKVQRNFVGTTDDTFSKEATMWAVAAMCQKSWYTCPSSFSMKSIFLIGYACGLVTFVAYSAAIVSSLAVIVVPIQNFKDFINFKYTFTVHESSDTMILFLQGLIDTFGLHQPVKTISTQIEIEHLINERKAFLSSPDNFYSSAYGLNYTDIFLCGYISTIPISQVPVSSGMFVKKGSQYTEMLSYKVMKIKERGLNRRYMRTYNSVHGVLCQLDKRKQAGQLDPVNTDDIYTALLCLLIGSVLSTIFFLTEMLLGLLQKSAKQYYNNIITITM